MIFINCSFISDGNDNDLNSLDKRLTEIMKKVNTKKKINFLTIGVGKSFPTFVAMKLREMYHNGETNLPPVFLIEDTMNEEHWLE